MADAAPTQEYDEVEFLQLVAACLQMADMGMVESFSEITEALLELDQNRAEVMLLHGMRCRAHQRNDEALHTYEKLIAKAPRMTLAHYHLGKLQQGLEQYEAAAESFGKCCEIDPTFVDAYMSLVAVCEALGKHSEGLDLAVTALNIDPTSMLLWSQVENLLPHVKLLQTYPPLIAALIKAFDAGISSQDFFIAPVIRCLEVHAPMQKLLALHANGQLEQGLESGEALTWLNDPFLLSVIRHILLMRPHYETLLTEIRKGLLKIFVDGAADEDALLGVLSALSSHCFINEYAFYETQEEAKNIDALLNDIGTTVSEVASQPQYEIKIAMVSCYRLLADVDECDAIEAALNQASHASMKNILKQQIAQPRKERRYKDTIETMTEIDDGVSKAVQAMYEAHPYPRWVNLPMIQQLTFPLYVKISMPYLAQAQLPKIPKNEHDELSILVAGCGTGQHPCMVARRFPNAKVLAVDLSRSSLGYAQMKADELGITNIEFRHGDIMKLPELGRQFDIVESVGVLHHMADPVAGWEAITQCLKPGGWMKIGLYDYHKRDFVRWAWDVINEKGYGDSDDEIRRFRHDMLTYYAEGLDDARCEHMIHTRDFFPLSECRDLLFHVQETQYTLDELRKIINTLGLKFVGVPMRVPNQWEQLKEGQGAITNWQSMKQWEAAQRARPELFHHMHMMWLRKPA